MKRILLSMMLVSSGMTQTVEQNFLKDENSRLSPVGQERSRYTKGVDFLCGSGMGAVEVVKVHCYVGCLVGVLSLSALLSNGPRDQLHKDVGGGLVVFGVSYAGLCVADKVHLGLKNSISPENKKFYEDLSLAGRGIGSIMIGRSILAAINK